MKDILKNYLTSKMESLYETKTQIIASKPKDVIKAIMSVTVTHIAFISPTGNSQLSLTSPKFKVDGNLFEANSQSGNLMVHLSDIKSLVWLEKDIWVLYTKSLGKTQIQLYVVDDEKLEKYY